MNNQELKDELCKVFKLQARQYNRKRECYLNMISKELSWKENIFDRVVEEKNKKINKR
ncbi:MAG: hypothetical protein ACOCRO_04460 [Halanaerobiales bacterium]